ncbi:hypothetical protein WR25_03961 [Diploscapter pachys]|uniref:Uncharacterized protein n=1 Tax=Diploscapter pachys TaxID=2018661 RepID=A0A2A2LJV2_9BILA|nr:hypothetical protein WR25_03961 [Diploscapter pachys]
MANPFFEISKDNNAGEVIHNWGELQYASAAIPVRPNNTFIPTFVHNQMSHRGAESITIRNPDGTTETRLVSQVVLFSRKVEHIER